MKNLDLNAYGVTEMNHREMVQTDGGGFLFIAAIAVAALYIIGTCCGLSQGKYPHTGGDKAISVGGNDTIPNR
jgi:hypothetical protein